MMTINEVTKLIAQHLDAAKSEEETYAMTQKLLEPFTADDLYNQLALIDKENVVLVEEIIEKEIPQSFDSALSFLKSGYFIARKGWNGKGMYLYLTEGSKINSNAINTESLKIVAENEQAEEVTILPHVDMKAADGSIVIGWLASQSDMLAEDWIIVSEGNSESYFEN